MTVIVETRDGKWWHDSKEVSLLQIFKWQRLGLNVVFRYGVFNV